MTGSFVVPGVFYLQSIRQEKDELIQSMGILFTTSTLALFFSLQTNEYLTSKLIVWSSTSIVPSIIGVLIGQQIREWLSEKTFKNVFLMIVRNRCGHHEMLEIRFYTYLRGMLMAFFIIR